MSNQQVIDPKEWIAEQQAMGRDLFLTLDRLAEPDPIVMLYQQDLMQDCVNLYSGTDFNDLKEVGPWLVKLPLQSDLVLSALLDNSHQNWGWLASAEDLDLATLAMHWRERMLIEEQGQKALYRFQDNRVIAHHLANLTPAQRPILMGPLHSVLSWHQGNWAVSDNTAPALYPNPILKPWLGIPEPDETEDAVLQYNLQQWLWEHHPAAVTQLVERESLQVWLRHQLQKARSWGWNDTQQLQFLLQHQLNPQTANPLFWAALEGETPTAHYQRCRNALDTVPTRSYQ